MVMIKFPYANFKKIKCARNINTGPYENSMERRSNYTFPFLERSIANGFVDENCASTILILAISGTARNAQATHQILDQNMRAMIMIKELRLSLSHITLGSMTFHEINCGIKRHASNIIEVTPLSNCTKEYKNGRASAIIPPIAGIKSSKNTKSPNISAYSKPKTIIMITLTPALKSARKNLERKKVFISS